MVIPIYLPRCPACPACSMCSANSSTSSMSPSLSLLSSFFFLHLLHAGLARNFCPSFLLLPNEFAEHFFSVDGDEDAAAAGQDFVFLVANFGFVDVLAAVHADFPPLDMQPLVEWYGLEVLDSHLFGEGDDVVELVHFPHRIVKDGGDDAAMAVAGRSGIALAEAEFADESLALFVEREFEAHAVGVVLAAGEAVVLLHFGVAGIVAFDLGSAGHGEDSIVIRWTSGELVMVASEKQVPHFVRNDSIVLFSVVRQTEWAVRASHAVRIPVYISVLSFRLAIGPMQASCIGPSARRTRLRMTRRRDNF